MRNYWEETYGQKSIDFIEGAIAAVETYAVYRDGVREIGSPEKPIDQVIDSIREGCRQDNNLMRHAREELERIGAFAEKGDFYGGMTGNAVMDLISVFCAQGHSGMSANLVRQLFDKAASFKPLSPITGDDDEWNEIDDGRFQNKRLSALFKNGKDGIPHYIDAVVWKEENGSCFGGRVDGISSAQNVNLPFTPKTFYIDVVRDENDESHIKDRSQLDAVWEYYRKDNE